MRKYIGFHMCNWPHPLGERLRVEVMTDSVEFALDSKHLVLAEISFSELVRLDWLRSFSIPVIPDVHVCCPIAQVGGSDEEEEILEPA